MPKPLTVAEAGSLGGLKRASKLSPERRREIAIKASQKAKENRAKRKAVDNPQSGK